MKFDCRKLLIVLFVIVQSNYCYTKRITKRQIYREQVLPHAGGKIPETAFHTDRLALNRLQKEGIAIPDGVMLDQRNPKVHPYSHNDLRPVFKVQTMSDNRYTPIEGQYMHFTQPMSETTYPIPRYTDDTIKIVPIQTTIYRPIYRPLFLPHPRMKNKQLKTFNVPPMQMYSAIKLPPFIQHHQRQPTIVAGLPYANYKLAIGHSNYPRGAQSKLDYFQENYITSPILEDLSAFFNHFDNQIP